MVLKLCQSLIVRHIVVLSQITYIVLEQAEELVLADTADGAILVLHADVRDIVQFAEDAKLAELGDARQKYEAQVFLLTLQRTDEVAHYISNLTLQFLVFHRVVHWRVVFVNEHHHLFASLGIGSLDDVLQSDVIRFRKFRIERILRLVFRQHTIECGM